LHGRDIFEGQGQIGECLSFAYELWKSGTIRQKTEKQPAETWFENDDADGFEVLEHCVMSGNNAIILLYLTDAEMFDDRFEYKGVMLAGSCITYTIYENFEFLH
jgi:hypothetical protein